MTETQGTRQSSTAIVTESSNLRSTAEDIVCRGWLTPSLENTLTSLYGAPAAVADATIQLLDFGSRAAMRELKLTTPPKGVSDDGRSDEQKRRDPVILTPLAREVMTFLHDRQKADPAGVRELAEMVQTALANCPS